MKYIIATTAVSTLMPIFLLYSYCADSHVVESSDCDARTTARNWRLSQSEALISCFRDSHAHTHAPHSTNQIQALMLMLSEMTRLKLKSGVWRSHHDLKTLKMAIFQQNIAQKWPLMAKSPNFLILIQYDYALRSSS